MLHIVFAILTLLAYSSDIIIGKYSTDHVPMYIFLFILALCYGLISVIMFLCNYRQIISYFSKTSNRTYILLSFITVFVGTVLADTFMWICIHTSTNGQLPASTAIIHAVPVSTAILITLFFRVKLKVPAIIGIVLATLGCTMTAAYTD